MLSPCSILEIWHAYFFLRWCILWGILNPQLTRIVNMVEWGIATQRDSPYQLNSEGQRIQGTHAPNSRAQETRFSVTSNNWNWSYPGLCGCGSTVAPVEATESERSHTLCPPLAVGPPHDQPLCLPCFPLVKALDVGLLGFWQGSSNGLEICTLFCLVLCQLDTR